MAKTSHVAVVGSCNVDLTTFNDRFPRAGETIFAESSRASGLMTDTSEYFTATS